MNCWKIFTALFLFVSLSACKKDSPELQPSGKMALLEDSLSFSLDEKLYVLEPDGQGFGNRQVNVKPYDEEISGRSYAYLTGNKFWYGSVDSTLYHAQFGFTGNVKVLFSKKFHNRELREGALFKAPGNSLSLFRLGQQRFAEDFGMENTMDGVALEVRPYGLPGGLTSYRPGFSVLVRPDMPAHLQEDSSFEIIRIERFTNNRMVVHARFEMNLYDEDGQLHRLKDGYLRVATPIEISNTGVPW